MQSGRPFNRNHRLAASGTRQPMYHHSLMRLKLRPFIPALILLTLLPSLAYLQYRWQGQVSEALRTQLQEQMRRAAGQFSEDFDRELGRVYENFQASLPEGGQVDARIQQLRRNYAELYTRWVQTSSYPNPWSARCI